MTNRPTNPAAEKRFTEMRTAMLLHTPFFASLLLDVMDLRVGKYPFVQTAGTNGKVIWFDEDFLAGLDLPEAVFLCCHEIAHAMWMHMQRGAIWKDQGLHGAPFSFELYNVATDLVINAMLVKSGIGRMPKDGLLSNKYTGDMLAEDVYKDLMKSNPPQGGGGGGNPGSGSVPGSNGKGKVIDQHILEVSSGVSEAEMKRAVATAVHQAKAMGKFPSALERWVEETLNPQVNWSERLRYLVNSAVGHEATSWVRPHRRRIITQRVYLPSYTGFSAGEIVCVTDTSGSMGAKEFDASWAEFSDIITNCRPERLWLMACDAKVHNVHELEACDDIYQSRPEMRGGGGTNFIPAFEEVDKRGIEPAVLVFFTDGYGTFPPEPPPYPVIWVMTTDEKPPFGDVVKVELSDYANA